MFVKCYFNLRCSHNLNGHKNQGFEPIDRYSCFLSFKTFTITHVKYEINLIKTRIEQFYQPVI